MGRTTKPVKRSKGEGGEAAYQALRERILSLSLAPGADLEESALVEALGLSRTPVREAIIRLASEGLVTLTPNRGARVASISLDEVRGFFEALDLCQRAVTRLAAARRREGDLARIREVGKVFESAARKRDADAMAKTNFDFHMAVADAGGNPWLARFFGELLNQGMRLSRLALVYDPPMGRSRGQHGQDIVEEHREMMEAVIAGDAAAAEDIASRHTDLFRRRVMGFIAENLTAAMVLRA
ncbi:MAG: GntR family transcriptional regulator [Alphaproteobacteria bacterium]|nr:GntR family transcriptional regulator [Alphaproteobacteria bacterium]